MFPLYEAGLITMKLEPKHEDSVIGKLLDLKRQIVHHQQNIQPRYGELEPWEIKEYHELHVGNMTRFGYFKDYIRTERILFDEILADYGLTVDQFITDELGSIDTDWPKLPDALNPQTT